MGKLGESRVNQLLKLVKARYPEQVAPLRRLRDGTGELLRPHSTRSRNLAARCRGCSLAARAGRLYLDYLADGAATRHHPPLPDADEAGGGWDQMLLSAWSE